MKTGDRREDILALAYERGQVTVRDLTQTLCVSEATVRRDLHSLADGGLLELTHGGAKVSRSSDYSFMSKSVRNVEAKKTIASLAAEFVDDGDQIFLDSGTTCFQMASSLRSKRSLSVIVHSVRTAQELVSPGVKTFILGGQYRPERMDTIGPMATASLERLRGFKAFVGTDGLGIDFGLTSVDIDSVHILSLAARNAMDTILLADSSKFDQPSLYKILDFSSISTVVTEKKPSDEWIEFLESQKIKTIYPS